MRGSVNSPRPCLVGSCSPCLFPRLRQPDCLQVSSWGQHDKRAAALRGLMPGWRSASTSWPAAASYLSSCASPRSQYADNPGSQGSPAGHDAAMSSIDQVEVPPEPFMPAERQAQPPLPAAKSAVTAASAVPGQTAATAGTGSRAPPGGEPSKRCVDSGVRLNTDPVAASADAIQFIAAPADRTSSASAGRSAGGRPAVGKPKRDVRADARQRPAIHAAT